MGFIRLIFTATLLTGCGKPITEVGTVGSRHLSQTTASVPVAIVATGVNFSVIPGSFPQTASAPMTFTVTNGNTPAAKTFSIAAPTTNSISLQMDTSVTKLDGTLFPICNGELNAAWTIPASTPKIEPTSLNLLVIPKSKSISLTITPKNSTLLSTCNYQWSEITSGQKFQIAINYSGLQTPSPTPSPTVTPTPSPTPSTGTTAFTPNDYSASAFWGLESISATTAWGKHRDCSNVAAAVVDTGILHTHEDLRGAVDLGFSAFRTVSTLSDTDSLSNDGHGTHVAGTIGASFNNGIGVPGICPGVRLIPVKVLENGRGSLASIEAGLDWMVEEQDRRSSSGSAPIVVANLSFGGTLKSYTSSLTKWNSNVSAWTADSSNPITTLSQIRNDFYGTVNTPGLWPALRDAGISLMIAAGNGADWGKDAAGNSTIYHGCIEVNPDGSNKSTLVDPGVGFDISTLTPKISSTDCLVQPGSFAGDTDYPNVMAISAIQKVGSTLSLTTFSNYGSNVHIAAPGKSIKSSYATSNSTYTNLDGTSMATPHVTGAWAYVASKRLKKNGALPSPTEIRTEILRKAGTVNTLIYRNRNQSPGAQPGVVGGKVLDMKNLE